jgi:hypothetical protein
MEKLKAARKLFEAGKKTDAKNLLKKVEPQIEAMIVECNGELRGDKLFNMGMFLNTVGSLGEHKWVIDVCKRWLQYSDDWELIYQAGVASFNLGRFIPAASYWSKIGHVPSVANMQFVAQLVERGTVPPFQLEYELPDPEVVGTMLERETRTIGKKGLRSGIVIMSMLEMAFDAAEAKDVIEIMYPLLVATGTWGKDLGFGLMQSEAVSKTIKTGVGSVMMMEGLIDLPEEEKDPQQETFVPEREKLSYDTKINVFLRIFRKQYEELDMALDTRYIDFYGDTCPRCGGGIRVRRGVVEDAASVSTYLLLEQNKAVAYCICKKCAKELTRFRRQDDGEPTEERIVAKLPDLKRS